MKNALILHGTDFGKVGNNREQNWFPWLDTELTSLGYKVSRPELPEPWHPDLNRYWDRLKDFNYNEESLLIGHSSGATTVFGLLHKLLPSQKINLAVSVAGFYKDDGWNCEGLHTEDYDWKKIKSQARQHIVIWSSDDPYITKEQTDYLTQKLNTPPVIFSDKGHCSKACTPTFPELLKLLREK
jgi:uncharacterized protein